MLAHRLGEGAEDDALLGQALAEGRSHAHGIEHGVHRHAALGLHASQHLPLVQRDAQLVEGFQQRGVDLVRAVFVAFGRRPVDDVLEIDGRQLEVPPLRRGHLPPLAERPQTELQQPVRLAFLGGNQADDVLVEALRHVLLGDFGHEAVLVLLGGEIPDQIIHRNTKIIILCCIFAEN